MVLTGTQSHIRQAFVSLANRSGTGASRRRKATERQRQIRLSDADIERVVSSYLAGAHTTELAGQFGVHRNTIQRLLKAHGVVLPHGPRAVVDRLES